MSKLMSKVIINKIAALSLLILLLMSAGGCSKLQNISEAPVKNPQVKTGNAELTDVGPVEGGSLNLSTLVPDTLNPILTKNRYTRDMLTAIYEGLVKLDKSMQPLPQLAKEWNSKDNGLTWTFSLRKDAVWQDGIPFTAADVTFTFEIILKTDSVYKKNLDKISFIEVIDDYTLKVQLKEPYSYLPEAMTFPIIPKHYFLNEDINSSARNMKPVGTGPYKFSEYVQDSHIALDVNDNWWNMIGAGGSKGGPKYPLFKQLKFYTFNNNVEMLEEFQEKDLDYIPVESDEWEKYSERSDIKIKKLVSRDYDVLSFNTKKPVFSESAVRKAIAQAIDKTPIISASKGRAVNADLPIPPDAWFYNSRASAGQDINNAKKLLNDNGWKEGWNKIPAKKIGNATVSLEFELLVNDDNSLRVAAANSISEQLKAVGINARVKKANWNDYQKALQTRNYDAAIAGWTIPSIPDYSFAYSSSEADKGMNISGLKSANIDRFLSLLKSDTDQVIKKEHYNNLQDAINDEMPYFGLYLRNSYIIYKNNIKGEITPTNNNMYLGLEKWYRPFR